MESTPKNESYGYSILNIANWFLAREESQYLTLEQVQKLCWYANEFTFANTNKRLFNDAFYIYKDIPSSITLLHNYNQYDLFEILPKLNNKPYIKEIEIQNYLENIFKLFSKDYKENISKDNLFIVHALEDSNEENKIKKIFSKIKKFFK